ncbi:hypothetical protein BC629DRAFT_1554158 [Irpex lacteus]|nr:hypothetical protein BC629DRAFT_1554158 [Irpex lacteus]
MSASSINNKFVKPGIYEIQSSATSLFLNPPNGSGDRLEALTLNGQGLRAGKWEIKKIGDGYTIRQVISGLFCALQNPVNCLDEPVVLSSMPTIWVIDMEDESEQIWISCPISHLAWEIMGTSESPEVGMGTPYIAHELPQKSFLWRLKPVREPSFSGKLAPGSYSIQNKASGTYTIECSPRNKDQFRANNTKIWEITPLGEGYSIRLLGADKYCTLEPGGVFKGNEIYLSPFPAAWKIVPNDSAMHSTGEEYFHGYGNKAPGTPIYLQSKSDFQECRLFKFVL